MKDLIKTIVKKKYTCIFLSPHQDDAVLSCGTLLSQLQGKVPVTVINVFTKARKDNYTLSAKTFMKYSNDFSDAEKLYQARLEEDTKVLSSLGIKPVNLNLRDALFRQKDKTNFLGKYIPELSHVYPTYRWHILKKIADNDPAIADLTRKLKKYKRQDVLVFAPYGLGNHVDHRIVRVVAESVFGDVILYSDFPYNNRLGTYGMPFKTGEMYKLSINKKEKSSLIAGYKTQFNGLFPNGDIPNHQEVYFSKQRIQN